MARAAVRDAGRVLDVPYGTVDRIAKLIPEGPKVYLDDCLKPGGELKAAYDADEKVRQIVDLAKPLEGLVRQDSIHAAGVVIGDRPLTEYVPLQQKGAGPGGRDAVPDGRRRGARAPEDGLPRPSQPRRDRQGDRPRSAGSTSRTIPLDDAKTYAMLAARRVERRLPVRVAPGCARRCAR